MKTKVREGARKNILLLITTAIGGGAERLILDQMKYHDRTKFNLHVVTLRKGYLEDEFSSMDVNYHCLNAENRTSYRAYKGLVNYIRINDIDVLHTHLYLPDIYGFLAKLTIPHVRLMTTKHNTNDFRKMPHWGLLDNILSLPADRIIAVSKSVKHFFSRYELIPNKRIKVIYHGVDASRFQKKVSGKRKKRDLGLEKNNFVIGIAGRMNRQKGHKYLLEAVAHLRPKIPHIKLLIIGTGELEASLRRYSYKLGIEKHVKFLGYRKDIATLYPVMDVFCLPSVFEGLGLVIIEAMLCGTLTVGARVDGITEIIEDGLNGFLFPPRNSTALAEILLKIHKTGFNRKMVERARESALRFDFRENLKKIEQVYLEILAAN